MSTARIKIFQDLGGAGINRVEAAANKWLQEQPEGTEVRDVQTALAECSEPDGGYQAIAVTIWYCPPPASAAA